MEKLFKTVAGLTAPNAQDHEERASGSPAQEEDAAEEEEANQANQEDMDVVHLQEEQETEAAVLKL